MKFLSILASMLLLTATTHAQMKLIKKLLSNEKDTTRKASFMPVPAIGYSQETGLELGLGALYAYYMDRKDPMNRSSNFSGTATYSTKKTYNLTLKGDAWTKGNQLHLIGELRFKKMPFNFYGTGNNTSGGDADRLIQRQFKILLEAERRVAQALYTGVSLGHETYDFTDREATGIFSYNHYTGQEGGQVTFTGLSQTYDTRNSNNYPTKGFFGRISFQLAPGSRRANRFSGAQSKINLKSFFPLSDQLVLGLQGFYHSLNGKNIPFYLLPQMGNDEQMRGYYTGRYRDRHLLASQAEIRYRYNNRFGAVLFAGTGAVFGQSILTTESFKPSYGGGLRYFFDPAKGLSVRLDYGIGEKKFNEKRQSGLYISLAEAF